MWSDFIPVGFHLSRGRFSDGTPDRKKGANPPTTQWNVPFFFFFPLCAPIYFSVAQIRSRSPIFFLFELFFFPTFLRFQFLFFFPPLIDSWFPLGAGKKILLVDTRARFFFLPSAVSFFSSSDCFNGPFCGTDPRGRGKAHANVSPDPQSCFFQDLFFSGFGSSFRLKKKHEPSFLPRRLFFSLIAFPDQFPFLALRNGYFSIHFFFQRKTFISRFDAPIRLTPFMEDLLFQLVIIVPPLPIDCFFLFPPVSQFFSLCTFLSLTPIIPWELRRAKKIFGPCSFLLL